MSQPESAYMLWVANEAAEMKSDNCTFSLDWNVWCCWEHDWTCSLARDPRDGYRLWKVGDPDYRINAKEMSRKDADKRFWKCNRSMVKTNRSGWKKFTGLLRTDFRYAGVRIGAFLPPY